MWKLPKLHLEMDYISICLLLICNVPVILSQFALQCPPNFSCQCHTTADGQAVYCEDVLVNNLRNEILNYLSQSVQMLSISGSPEKQPTVFTINDRETFNGLAFRELHLTHMRIDHLRDRIFAPLAGSLRLLNLSYNEINSLNENTFTGLSSLTHLNLDGNDLTSMPSLAVLASLRNLRTLTVANNHIDDFAHPVDQSFPSNFKLPIEVLDLSGNPLGAFDSSHGPSHASLPAYFFEHYPALQILNVSNTSISQFPWEVIQKFNPELMELDLSNNSFQEFKTNQLDVTNLRRINLRGNPIMTFEADAFSRLFLESLDLGGIPQRALTVDTFRNARIQRLSLADMGLQDNLDIWLQHLAIDLEELDISGNPSVPIGRCFVGFLPQLTKLVMNRMNLASLRSDIFRCDNRIQELELAYNRFDGISAAVFAPLTQLQRIDLSHNLLRSIPLSIRHPGTTDINLSYNQLQSFPDRLLVNLLSNQTIVLNLELARNPWKCDCGVAALAKWLANVRPLYTSYYASTSQPIPYGQSSFSGFPERNDSAEATCAFPSTLRLVKLKALLSRTFEKCPVGDLSTSSSQFSSFRCFVCRPNGFSAKCAHPTDMLEQDCRSPFGQISSCLRSITDEGTIRECGVPDEDVADQCDYNQGPHRNQTWCACRSELCNDAAKAAVTSTIISVLILVYVSVKLF